MKKVFNAKMLWAAVLALVVGAGLTSCDGDDYYYWDGPESDWGWIDNRLTGYWQLVQYNSDPVPAGEANYLYFNGDGRGTYFYLDDGYRMTERLRYGCQSSVNGASNYQINIRYEYHNPWTTSYWFTHGNNTLWMQWQTGGGRVQTYVYDRIGGAPW